MKINFELKLKIKELVSRERSVGGNIVGIQIKEKDKLYNFVLEKLENPCYIVYKTGNKYNSRLEIVCKDELIEYFALEYDIFSLDTLDFLNLSELPLEDDSVVMEVYATGKFNHILNALKSNFTFNPSESRFL